MALNFFFALPFCHSQNSIIEISNDFVCLFVLMLNVPVNNFSVMTGRSHCFLSFTSIFWEYFNCLAQGHNTAVVGFQPRFLAPESDAVPLSHHAPQVSNAYSHHDYHKISKVYFELNAEPLDGPLRNVLPLLCAHEDTLKIGQLALCSQSYRISPSL